MLKTTYCRPPVITRGKTPPEEGKNNISGSFWANCLTSTVYLSVGKCTDEIKATSEVNQPISLLLELFYSFFHILSLLTPELYNQKKTQTKKKRFGCHTLLLSQMNSDEYKTKCFSSEVKIKAALKVININC